MNTTPTFDRTAQKVQQIVLISTVGIGYIIDVPALIWAGAVLLAIALLVPSIAPQRFVYLALQRAGVVRPQLVAEDPAPHRFAQVLGLSMLVLASIGTLLGWYGVAWALALVVVFLATVNVSTGFCAGCFLHMQLSRWGRAS